MSIADVLTSAELDALDGVCRQAFDCLASLSDAQSVPDTPLALDWASRVCYEGEAAGSLLVRCSAPFACAFTEAFMGIPQPSELDGDVGDALGELANTIGGNYKGLLPPDTRLSVPEVGTSAELGANGTDRPLARITYVFETGACEVSLHSAACTSS